MCQKYNHHLFNKRANSYSFFRSSYIFEHAQKWQALGKAQILVVCSLVFSLPFLTKLKLPKQKTFAGPAFVWKRVLAFLIDLLIINFIILFPFRKLFREIMPTASSFKETFNLVNTSELNSLILTISIFASILMMLYFIILERKIGQSIGKILTNVYVVSELKELKFWQLLVRNLFLIPFFPFIMLWVADPLFMFFTKDKKRLSEILSKTKVIEKYQY